MVSGDSHSKHALPAPAWSPDLGDGTFRNPVICADYSDPDVIRDGDDYYLTASSFACTPGLPILHSRDLVNWTIVNYAIKNVPHERYRQMQPGCGVWAPAIRKHDGKFWIFFPMPDEGIYVTTATNPHGRWSEPWLLQEGKGLIDPCPLWDDDGKAYLVYAYARSRCGIKHRLSVAPMAPDASRLIGEAKTVFDQPEKHPTLEGPKFHKRNGYYYISAPAGGVKTGWQVILRSRDVFGPYEDKIVLAQGSTPINGPHQGAIVDAPDGKWWFIHFQDAGVYGRITHLQPVRWENDWPLMGINQNADDVGEPVLTYLKPIAGHLAQAPQTSDDFDSPTLGLQWQWQANHEDAWHDLSVRQGYLRLPALAPADSLTTTPGLLLQKFPAFAFFVDTQLETSSDLRGQAGLAIVGTSHAAIVLERTTAGRRVVVIVDDKVTHAHAIEGGSLRLRVEVADGGRCRFSFAEADSAWTRLGDEYQAVEGHWIGAKVGLFCRGSAGHADFPFFRVMPADT